MKKNSITIKNLAAREATLNKWMKQMKKANPEVPHYILLAIIKEAVKNANEVEHPHKKLTKKQQVEMRKETKAKRAEVLSLPPVPFENITPAPALGKMTLVDLAGYVSDKFPKINAISEFSTCSPTVASVVDIYTAFYPLANLNPHKISASNKTLRDRLAKQLRQQFLLMMNSCANLSLGNLSLFQLTEVATKRSAVKHDGVLPAPVFTLAPTAGAGKMKIVAKVIRFAQNYTVFYREAGTADVYISKTGSTRQTITGLSPGKLYEFYMVANSKISGPGEPSSPQTKNAPFN